MKVVILAGGKGTRIGEETKFKPKPMVEIGGMPILWHIMKCYSAFGYHEFIVCCGYKGNMIKKYFTEYYMRYSNVKFNMSTGEMEFLNNTIEPWKVTLVNTGLHTLTARRIAKIKRYIGEEEEFMLTYGDGVSNIDIEELIDFHHKSGKCITISVTKPEGRFGAVSLDYDTKIVSGFKEKARNDQSYVNIGFMVCNRKIFDYLGDEDVMLEGKPFERIVKDKEMAAYEHKGFWSPMDNLKDREYLEKLWHQNAAPWLEKQSAVGRIINDKDI
ncbi:MAG: glucose-1-phosphate cytidylyltransferase [Lachnospiraceae bacterium]